MKLTNTNNIMNKTSLLLLIYVIISLGCSSKCISIDGHNWGQWAIELSAEGNPLTNDLGHYFQARSCKICGLTETTVN